ncbi:sugar phosphate isomerase/epimerase family protein [Mongoliibacter ruber]|uniref:Secreted protein n=1 Tax=Mongoliibacter ruber TaxID=1750599 RepID=A0A2T0WGQ0_9BACT|nr:TIM barrel protein [Mongoliibacter ruber]PRY85890.1 secreted protein [Mongoliibacter ruber]
MRKSPLDHHCLKEISRRDFIRKSSMAGILLAVPFPHFSQIIASNSMGIVVHSYWSRWQSKADSQQFPAFENALQLLNHCKSIGAGGIQVGVQNWTEDFATNIQKEKEGMFVEGSISLPKDKTDVSRFEHEILTAKKAGVEVFRTVCLSGRRYENFHSKNEFEAFKQASIQSLKLASKVVSKHQVKLAIENHKDWRAEELVDLVKMLDNEYVGVTIDFGNNLALMEDPNEVIEILAPFAFSTHIKDMGVKEDEKGFLLSEVPLGQGIVDLGKAVETCKKHNPEIRFSLEMITRDPLSIPCKTEEYWATFPELRSSSLETMNLIRQNEFEGELPAVSHLSTEEKLSFEEENILKCLQYSKETLNIGI